MWSTFDIHVHAKCVWITHVHVPWGWRVLYMLDSTVFVSSNLIVSLTVLHTYMCIHVHVYTRIYMCVHVHVCSEWRWSSLVLLPWWGRCLLAIKWLMNLIMSQNHSIMVHHVYIKPSSVQTSCTYSLLMRANKLKTATVQGSLTCLAPPWQSFSCTCGYCCCV